MALRARVGKAQSAAWPQLARQCGSTQIISGELRRVSRERLRRCVDDQLPEFSEVNSSKFTAPSARQPNNFAKGPSRSRARNGNSYSPQTGRAAGRTRPPLGRDGDRERDPSPKKAVKGNFEQK